VQQDADLGRRERKVEVGTRMTNRTLLAGGWVIPMTTGQEPFRGDVLVEDDRIAGAGQLGPHVDAEIVDCRDQIVLPGLIDSHRHLWQSALRGIAGDWTLGQYFARMRGQLGGRFRPEDTYAATLLGAVEALDAGVTTVVDWSHNINGPEHADAGWQALIDAGGRAVFAYGASNEQALARDGSPHTHDVRRLRAGPGSDDGARVTLGMAVRGPEFSTLEAAAADWALARELGVPVTVHVGGGLRGAGRHVAELARRGLLGPDTTYVHCNMLADDELDAIADAGGRASVAPEVEANMGHGPAATARLRARGIPTGLSVDVCTNVGGDLFGAMRATLALARGAAHETALAAGEARDRVSLRAAEVLAMATIEGARAIGLDDRIGSLEPGRQADLLVIRADAPNIAPVSDPVTATVLAAGVHNVDGVLVAGRWVKRDGRFAHRVLREVVARAQASHDHLLSGMRDQEWCPPVACTSIGTDSYGRPS
jgi:cytosine/adenosine deaminase-related metal-dependent hydrolase